MEDVLEIYQRPYDPLIPVVCMDETSKQLLRPVRDSLAPSPGRVRREDYEYERNGVANLFLAFEPLAGRRMVEVTAHRTAQDWAQFMRRLLEGPYAKAKRVILVLDNLNVHSGASFYEAFEAFEARRLLERLEFHHTPKHGSWLNMAEGEFSILQRQCLSRRIGDPQTLRQEINAWQGARNEAEVGADWQFTTADARIKLNRLYPSFEA